MRRFSIWAVLLATLVSCSQNEEPITPNGTTSKKQTEFYASMATCDSRTFVEDNKYLRWNAGDEITIFNGNSYNSHWQFAGADGANSGKFTEIDESGFVTGTPLDLTAHYAIYPYDENITITEAGVVSLTLPAIQAYNHDYANSFGRGANTMMAVTKNTSDNFLAFKNLCGYLKLKLYGDNVTVKSVTVKGNNGEKIAGAAKVTMSYGSQPIITMDATATETITIDCGEGVALSNDPENPTIFWVAIPEITFEGGITIEVTDINGGIFIKQTTKKIPISNNYIQPMATIESYALKIGDMISYNGQKGIIYSTENSIIKIVSVDVSDKLAWCKPEYSKQPTGATDLTDGRINIQIMKEKGYFSYLPAFLWCENYGQDWYLPAATELHTIYKAKSIIDSTLSANGYQTLNKGLSHYYYWSSTEDDANYAKSRDFGNGYSHDSYKNSEFYVRAVAVIEI